MQSWPSFHPDSRQYARANFIHRKQTSHITHHILQHMQSFPQKASFSFEKQLSRRFCKHISLLSPTTLSILHNILSSIHVSCCRRSHSQSRSPLILQNRVSMLSFFLRTLSQKPGNFRLSLSIIIARSSSSLVSFRSSY